MAGLFKNAKWKYQGLPRRLLVRIAFLTSTIYLLTWTAHTQAEIDYDKLQLTQMEIDSVCGMEITWRDCKSAIEEVQFRPGNEHKDIQIVISQVLVSKSGIYPEALNYAYDMLSMLIDKNPKITAYLDQRAFVKYYQEPVNIPRQSRGL